MNIYSDPLTVKQRFKNDLDYLIELKEFKLHDIMKEMFDNYLITNDENKKKRC